MVRCNKGVTNNSREAGVDVEEAPETLATKAGEASVDVSKEVDEEDSKAEVAGEAEVGSNKTET